MHARSCMLAISPRFRRQPAESAAVSEGEQYHRTRINSFTAKETRRSCTSMRSPTPATPPSARELWPSARFRSRSGPGCLPSDLLQRSDSRTSRQALFMQEIKRDFVDDASLAIGASAPCRCWAGCHSVRGRRPLADHSQSTPGYLPPDAPTSSDGSGAFGTSHIDTSECEIPCPSKASATNARAYPPTQARAHPAPMKRVRALKAAAATRRSLGREPLDPV